MEHSAADLSRFNRIRISHRYPFFTGGPRISPFHGSRRAKTVVSTLGARLYPLTGSPLYDLLGFWGNPCLSKRPTAISVLANGHRCLAANRHHPAPWKLGRTRFYFLVSIEKSLIKQKGYPKAATLLLAFPSSLKSPNKCKRNRG